MLQRRDNVSRGILLLYGPRNAVCTILRSQVRHMEYGSRTVPDDYEETSISGHGKLNRSNCKAWSQA